LFVQLIWQGDYLSFLYNSGTKKDKIWKERWLWFWRILNFLRSFQMFYFYNWNASPRLYWWNHFWQYLPLGKFHFDWKLTSDNCKPNTEESSKKYWELNPCILSVDLEGISTVNECLLSSQHTKSNKWCLGNVCVCHIYYLELFIS
jgi:hypothetical protein